MNNNKLKIRSPHRTILLSTFAGSLVFLYGLLSFSIPLYARVLSPQEAQERFFKSKARFQAQAIEALNGIKLLQTVEVSGEPAVYLFSKNERGFYILSADDNTEALLGYGDNVLSDSSIIHPAMNYWLEKYAHEIGWVRINNVPGKTFLRKPIKRDPIAPLLTTKWGQGTPFNSLCPQIDGKHCLTGCVATAMAQIMNYHKYPSSVSVQDNSTYAESDNITFDWANMLDSYYGNLTESQIKAVAQLMSVCGKAVDMDYGLGESSASNWNAGKALIDVFDYNKNIDYLLQDNYTPTEWNDIVYGQLLEYGPVLYSGQSSSGGHAFVVDGYDSNEYFHINWGWEGGYDGYFRLNALDPGNPTATGYANKAGIVINIRPEVSQIDYTHSIICANGLTVSSATTALGTQTEIGYLFEHYGYSDLIATIGFRIVDSEGNETILESDGGGRTFSPNSCLDYVGLTIPAGFSDGVYKVYPVFITNGDTYAMHVSQQGNQNLELNVANGNTTFKATGMPEIVFKGVTMKSQFYRNRAVAFDYNIENQSDKEVCKNFCAALFNSTFTSILATGQSISVNLEAGESISGEYSSKFNTYPAAGMYYFGIYNPESKKVYAYMPVQLQEEPTTTITASAMNIIGGSTGVNPKEVKFSVTLNCSEGYYSDALHTFVFKEGESNSNWKYTLPDVRLSEGETIIPEFTIDLTSGNPDYDSKYFLVLVQPSSTTPLAVSPLFTLAKTIETGIPATSIQELPADEEIYTLDGIRVRGCIPAGIYIVRHRYNNGRVTTERVVVNKAR